MNITKVNEIKTMSSLEIAELTGKRHDNIVQDIRKMLEELGKAAPDFSGTAFYEVNGAKRSREIFNLPKDLTITLVSRYSYVASNIIINRWLELEDTVARISSNQSDTSVDIYAIGALADVMRVAESSKLGMLKTYCTKNAPRLLPCLPQYAVDTFKEGDSGSSEATLPLTSLLEGTDVSAVKANAILIKEGILEELVRPSSKGGVKKFKSITAKGLSYGKNMTSPVNPRETQPHWYVNKKQELLAIITKN